MTEESLLPPSLSAVFALGEGGRAAAHGERAAAGGGTAAPGRVAAQAGAAGLRPVPPGEGPQGRRGSEEVGWLGISLGGIILGGAATCSGGFVKNFLRVPRLLGCTAGAMLPKQARGTFRKHITKPSEQVAAPPSRFMEVNNFHKNAYKLLERYMDCIYDSVSEHLDSHTVKIYIHQKTYVCSFVLLCALIS